MQFDNQNPFENNDISPLPWIDYNNQDKLYDSNSKTDDLYNFKHLHTEPIQDKVTSKNTNGTTKPDKLKRKQVKNACVNCQKACKKCDDGRPCKRCVKLGLTSTCRDSDRKERKKGVKRGPYKKRQTFNKDKPVYPKLTDGWKPPVFENVPQVLSHNVGTWPPMVSPLPSAYYEDKPFYPSLSVAIKPDQFSQQLSSPTSYTSYESDELLNYTYAYGYTNTSMTTVSSPSSISMLGHNSISDNATPIQTGYYSWDDPNAHLVDNVSPIGCDPIDFSLTFPPALVQKTQFQPENTLVTYPITSPTDWIPLDLQPTPPLHPFPEYTVPSSTPFDWTYAL